MTFPTMLPQPQMSGYGVNPASQVERTEMESGAARARRVSRAELDAVPITWVFSEAEMATFRAWYRDPTGANAGAAWFDLALPLGNGAYTAGKCRFTEAWKASRLGGRRWRVTASLEVRHA